jgi:hypothetical protein
MKITVYRFKIRSSSDSRKWVVGPDSMTVDEARQRHGEANYVALDWTKKVLAAADAQTGKRAVAHDIDIAEYGGAENPIL